MINFLQRFLILCNLLTVLAQSHNVVQKIVLPYNLFYKKLILLLLYYSINITAVLAKQHSESVLFIVEAREESSAGFLHYHVTTIKIHTLQLLGPNNHHHHLSIIISFKIFFVLEITFWGILLLIKN